MRRPLGSLGLPRLARTAAAPFNATLLGEVCLRDRRNTVCVPVATWVKNLLHNFRTTVFLYAKSSTPHGSPLYTQTPAPSTSIFATRELLHHVNPLPNPVISAPSTPR
ncbi:hypothetical protein M758_UG022900 [Ceratodon purpureus]|nr:hypothetical protein M758_UG022900 [Ceratodon purpureus]